MRRTGALPVAAADDEAIEAAATKVLSRARGQNAPAEAIRLVRLAAKLPLAEGLAEERATFLRLRDSDQAKALRHVFFAERAAAKVAGLDGVEPRTVRTIGVVGTGLMGSGIAVAALDAGYTVIGVETTEDAAAKGRERIAALLDRAVKAGRLDAGGRAERLARLSVTASAEDLANADLVIEAVFDDLAVKTELFARLDRIVRPDTILATNTSYLDPDVIAAATARPERVLGLHFFSPANIMRLVEVVRCAKTAPDVLATGLAVAKKLGKLPVVSGVCEGFIGNRIFSAYRREAEFLLEDGALPQEIDAAMEGYGFAMGPFAVFDLAGLEIAWARRKRQAATRDPNERYVEIADRLCEAGRFGQKTGRGWYAYPDGRRTVDPEVTEVIEAARAKKGITPRAIGAEEIVVSPARRDGGGRRRIACRRNSPARRRHRPGDDQRLWLPGPQGRADVCGGAELVRRTRLFGDHSLRLDLDLVVADQIAGLHHRVGRHDLAEHPAMGARHRLPFRGVPEIDARADHVLHPPAERRDRRGDLVEDVGRLRAGIARRDAAVAAMRGGRA